MHLPYTPGMRFFTPPAGVGQQTYGYAWNPLTCRSSLVNVTTGATSRVDEHTFTPQQILACGYLEVRFFAGMHDPVLNAPEGL